MLVPTVFSLLAQSSLFRDFSWECSALFFPPGVCLHIFRAIGCCSHVHPHTGVSYYPAA